MNYALDCNLDIPVLSVSVTTDFKEWILQKGFGRIGGMQTTG